VVLLFWTINFVTVGVVYFIWIRPILRKTPALKSLYDREETCIAALSAKFAGIKQRLTAAFVYLAGVVVVMHDYLAPKLTGVDITPLFPKIMTAIPHEAWPLIAIGITGLLDYFRYLADKRQE
jgi:hypothetical protein